VGLDARRSDGADQSATGQNSRRGRNSENSVDQTPRKERDMRIENSRSGRVFGIPQWWFMNREWVNSHCRARLQHFPRPGGLDARRSDGADQSPTVQSSRRGQNTEESVNQTPRIERVMKIENSRSGRVIGMPQIVVHKRSGSSLSPGDLTCKKRWSRSVSDGAELAAWPEHRRFCG